MNVLAHYHPMNNHHIHSIKPAALAGVLSGVLLILGATAASAAADTWTGGGSPDGNWQNPANWGGTAPLAGDFLYLDTGTQLLATNNYSAGTIFGNLTFNGTAGSFSVYGNSLSITNPASAVPGGTAGAGTVNGGDITNSSPNPESIFAPINLLAGKHIIETDGGGQLNLNGNVTPGPGAVAVFEPNNGAINVTGGLSTNNFNGIFGGWATLGNDWAAEDNNSNVVAFANYTDIASGAIANAPTSNVKYTGESANITSANGTAINSLMIENSAARTVTITGTLRLGSRGGIMRDSASSGAATVTGGNITTAGSGGQITIGCQPFNATANNLTVASAITNDTGGPVSVNVVGYVVLSGNSTYSGGTYITQGRVQMSAEGAFGTGPVYVFPGGHAFLNTGTVTNDFYISGLGSTEASGNSTGPGAIRNNGESSNGRIILLGNARYGTSSANSVQRGQVTGNGQLEIASFTGNQNVTFANTSLVNTNNWTGGLYITALGSGRQIYFKCGYNNQLGGNNVTIGGLDVARLDLDGNNDYIGGLISSNSANFQVANFSNYPSILTLGANNATATFGGVINDNGNVSSNLSIVKIGTGTQTFLGALNYHGGTTVSGGDLVFGPNTVPAPQNLVAVNNGGMLDVSAVTPWALSTNSTVNMANGTLNLTPVSSGAALTTSTLNAGGVTNYIGVASIPTISTYPAQFQMIKYTNLVGTLNFGLGGSLPASPSVPYAGYISNNVANGSVDLVITGGPTAIVWTGFSSGAPNTAWDTSTPNWQTFAGSSVLYSDGEFVLFNDSASSGTVSVNQNVLPAGIIVSNSALPYTFTGGGGISGPGGLSKLGSGTLILDNSGGDTFSNTVSVSAGVLQVGNGDGNGNLPATIGVVNSGTLVFDRSSVPTVVNPISGSGSLVQEGGDTLTLSGLNSFSGAVTVTSNSVLQQGSAAALGGLTHLTTVAGGSTLDLYGFTAPGRLIAAGSGTTGQGAIDNSSATIPPADLGLTNLTLVGNTTIGTSGARWDLRSPGGTTGNPATATLSTGGTNYNLTKVGQGGGGFFGLASVTVDTNLGNVDIQAGTFDFEGNTTGLGNPTNTLTVENGAIFEMYSATNKLNKIIVVNDGGSVLNGQGADTIVGPVILTNVDASSSPVCYVNVANGAGYSMTWTGPVMGNAILEQYTGTNTLTLSGISSNFAGGVTVNAGTLVLSGVLSNAFGVMVNQGTMVFNGTLLGGGITNAPGTTLIGSGASSTGTSDFSGNIVPGGAGVMGTLTLGSLTLEGSAVLNFDLGPTNTPGAGSNDLVVVNGDFTVNGPTININPTGLLLTGVPYRLFNYTGNLIWNSDLNIPTLANGYAFTFNTNTPGQVNVVVSGGPPVWNGGSVVDSNWSDTNNWGGVTVAQGDFLYFSGLNRLVNTNDTVAGNSYGDIDFVAGAGAFVLNGNPVTLGGSNILNSSSSNQTINLGLNFGTPYNFNGGSGGLTIGGGLTNTSSGFNTLNLMGTGILTNIVNSVNSTGTNTVLMNTTNANWTIVDNSSSTPMVVPWVFNINLGSVTFGSATSAPTLTSTTVNGAPQDNQVGDVAGTTSTFTMVNGTLTTFARLNTALVSYSTGVVNQVGGVINMGSQFQGANGGTTNALSIVTISGGTMNIGAATNATSPFYVASRDMGILTLTNTGALNCGNLDVSRDANGNTRGSSGTVNLNGGVISCSRVGTATANSQSGPASSGVSPVAAFNFNGGTLKATASSATFFQGSTVAPVIPITSTVKIGGAIINDGGFNISVLEPLQHDSTLGASPDGGLTKLGAGNLTMGAASTYTGGTLVSAGTLTVSGSLGATAVTVATNATLSGSGSIGGSVTVGNGGTLAPGALGVIGTLTVAGNVSLQGTTAMDLNQSTLTNDVLKGAVITYGGTLSLTNLAGALTATNTFKLFSGTSYAGAFAAITPAIPGTGLAWNTNTLTTDGTLRLVATVNTSPTNITFAVSGSQLTLSWPADHIGWRLQVQTNSTAVGLSTNWVNVPGATTVDTMTFTNDPNNGTVFYQMVYP